MHPSILRTAAIGTAAAFLAACAATPTSPNVPTYNPPAAAVAPPTGTGPNEVRGTVAAPVAYNTGVVSSIELMRGQTSSGISPGGAILGAVVGGLVGNQVGAGRGKALATGAGVVGGALAGNAVGNRVNSTSDTYRVAVQYDGGGSQYIDVPHPGDLRVGDRVRVENGQISRY